MIGFGEQIETGDILIESDGEEALVGMEFLRQFRLALTVDPISDVVQLRPSAGLKNRQSATSDVHRKRTGKKTSR